ncbi:MAG: DUF2079 domain-containing protein [Anaerolineae bacterium]|nr:DUF2079 domain-containing protein [Anaerolineae bacterium]
MITTPAPLAPPTTHRPSATAWLAAHWPALAVWLLIGAYIVFFGTLTVRQHDAFETTAFDLGNVDQAVWNTRHGRPFAMTNIEGLENRLGTHVEPILLLVSLLYFVWSDPRALLLLQTVVIALGAWAVYLLARRALGNLESGNRESGIGNLGERGLAVAFAVAYLLFPALESANVFDFHAVALAPTFFLFALYFLERERWGAYALFAVLTMSCKEDMPLLVAMLGVYALVVRRRWAVGLATVVVAVVWFLLAVGWVMPQFDAEGVSPLANRYSYLGDSPVDMLVTMLTRPGMVLQRALATDNLVYALKLLAPVAFLSLLAPQLLFMALPPLAVNLLSTDGYMHELERFHYGITLVPVVVAAGVYGSGWLVRRLPRMRVLPLLLSGLVLVASLAYHRAFGYTPLAAGFAGTWPQVTEHDRLGEEIARNIPTGASLAALPYPNPHASQRHRLHMIDRMEKGLLAPLGAEGDVPADYVWVDVTDSWPLHPNDLKRGIVNLVATGYGVDRGVDGWLLLRRGAPGRTLPNTFYDLARAPDADPTYDARLVFYLDGEPAVEMLGFDMHYAPQSDGYGATFYWRALQSLPPNVHLYPFFFADADGRILEDTTQRPMVAILWYPLVRWQVGEVVKTTMLPWAVGDDFSVGVGAVRGDEWAAVENRLPITVESSDLVTRLFDDDTWARLIEIDSGRIIEERRQFDTPAPGYALDIDFDGKVTLLGYDLDCDRGMSVCDLVLYWRAQEQMTTSYTVFAQLIGPAGNVRAQVDSIPQEGGYPTTWWLPGEMVVDQVTLTIPQTENEVTYHLIVGLYDPVTVDRLMVHGTALDYVELEWSQDN